MVSYMLDTNICIYILAKTDPGLNVMTLMRTGQVKISSIVYAELSVGARNYPRDDAAVQLSKFIAQVPVAPFDTAAAEAYGVLRRGLPRASGMEFDRLIAAHAISRSAILVINNEADFAGLEPLKLDNWTSA